MRYNYDSYKSILIIDKRLTKELFLEKAGVKTGTYAESVFARIYSSIFSELTNLEEEYSLYYNVEYPNIKDFMYRKFCITPEMIENVFSIKEQSETYGIYLKKDDFSYGDYQIFDFAFSESMYEKITKILLMK